MAKQIKKKQNTRISNIPVVNKKNQEKKTLIYTPLMTVAEVALNLAVSNAVVIKNLMQLGVMTNINTALDRDTVELLAAELGFGITDEIITDAVRFDEILIEDDEKDLVQRAPIVTIMGHVDHGKTTLLDVLRQSRVVAGEAGGITQHIGAYQIVKNGKSITFIDTPGHAAFTEMRARGAKVTDITILVVAADDGVMPQTLEALDHAKAASVPIIVAVNKIDKASANPEKIMTELAERGLTPEVWGGNTPFVQISALKGIGIDELLETIQLISEIENLRANPNRLASGTVIEAFLDKGRGPVATIIVGNGTLKVGDNIVCGTTFGKIRTMNDDLKTRYNEALPSQAVEITGLTDVPSAGDVFMVFSDEKEAKSIASLRLIKQKELENRNLGKISLDNLLANAAASTKELNLIIRGDVFGSIQALSGMLEKIDIEGFHVNIIRASVGAITENDVTLASTSNAIIIGFNVRPTADVRKQAENRRVEIRLYNVIYRIAEDIEAALKGMLEPVFEEVITGQLEVRDTFTISKVGTIAGCYVTDGFVKRDALVRILRDGIVVYEGKLQSLKRFKDDAKEVKQGYECGIQIEKFNDIKVGDLIEASQVQEVK